MAGWSLTESGRALRTNVAGREPDESNSGQVGASATPTRHSCLITTVSPARACTDCMRPVGQDPLAINDHTDHEWTNQYSAGLSAHREQPVPILPRLAAPVCAVQGHDDRFSLPSRAGQGEHSWVNRTKVDPVTRYDGTAISHLIATRCQRGGAHHRTLRSRPESGSRQLASRASLRWLSAGAGAGLALQNAPVRRRPMVTGTANILQDITSSH